MRPSGSPIIASPRVTLSPLMPSYCGDCLATVSVSLCTAACAHAVPGTLQCPLPSGRPVGATQPATATARLQRPGRREQRQSETRRLILKIPTTLLDGATSDLYVEAQRSTPTDCDAPDSRALPRSPPLAELVSCSGWGDGSEGTFGLADSLPAAALWRSRGETGSG